MKLNEYVKKDISEKKLLLDVYPKNTRVRQKKYLDTLDEIYVKYEDILASLKKFINYKYDKLKILDNNVGVNQELFNEKDRLLTLMRYGNKINSFYEKFELDTLLYRLSFYRNFDASYNDSLIIKILSVFKSLGVELKSSDFYLSLEVKEYMESLLNTSGSENDRVAIFWKCPNLFEIILICFRQLIEKNYKILSKNAKKYIDLELKNSGDVKQLYYKCTSKLNEYNDECENSIILKCYEGVIDYNNLSCNFSSLSSSFELLSTSSIDISNEEEVNRFINSVQKLKYLMIEYKSFLDNKILFDYFSNKYKDFVMNINRNRHDFGKDVSIAKKKITREVKALNKFRIPEKLTSNNSDKIFKKNALLTQIYEDYKNYDNVYYDNLFRRFIRENTTASDILYFLISYPKYALGVIGEVYSTASSYDIFNLLVDYYYNEHKCVYDMYYVFNDDNMIDKLISGFNFENIKLNESDFDINGCDNVIKRCDDILRRVKASHFKTSIDKIKFICDVDKLKSQNKI